MKRKSEWAALGARLAIADAEHYDRVVGLLRMMLDGLELRIEADRLLAEAQAMPLPKKRKR